MTTRMSGVMRVVCVAVLCAVTLVCAATAQARVLFSSTHGLAAGPARAADGRLVVGERIPGAIRAIAVDPRGRRSPQSLEAFSTAGAPTGGFTSATLTGTGGVIGVTIHNKTGYGPKGLSPELRASRASTLLPSAALGSCTPPGYLGTSIQVAGGAGFAATLGEECRSVGGDVRIHGAAGVRIIRVAPGAQTSLLSAAGGYVAWAEVTSASQAPSRYSVVLARAATGEVLQRIPVRGFGAADLAVGADGSLAWTARSALFGCTNTLYAVSLVQPVPRPLTGPATPCPFGGDRYVGQRTLAIAGSRVVYPASPRWALADGNGGATLIAEVAASSDAGPIAFDGRTVYAIRSDCDADRLLAIDADTPGPAPAGSALEPLSCPVTRAGSTRLRVDARRRVTIRLRCPQGCHGELRLVQQRRSRERVAGSTNVGGRGDFTVRVPLAHYAGGLAGCANGVRVRASFHQAPPATVAPPIDTPVSLGPLRLRATGRCRPRLPAPSFTYARP